MPSTTMEVPLPGTRARLIDGPLPTGRKSYAALRAATDEAMPIPDPRVTGATAYIGRAGRP